MHKDDWAQLPQDLQDFIWTDITDINDDLFEKYNLKFGQLQYINIVEDKVILKNISVLDIPKELESMSGADKLDLRAIALDLAIRVFAPIRDYVDDVDRLILRLGGKVPPRKPLQKKTQKDDSSQYEKYAEGKLEDLLSKYKNLKEQRISSNKIINKEGRKVSPTIDNWIKDYVHFLGAGDHSSLERAKYLSKSDNVLGLNKEDRKNIGLFIMAYDNDEAYVFEKRGGVVKLSELKKVKKSDIEDISKHKTVDGFLADLKTNMSDLEKTLISDKILLAEIDNDTKKLRELLWDSLGLGDKEKSISCIKLMLERKSFDASIKEDNRLRSILKRFLNIKYGKKFDNFLENNNDKLLLRRLFLEMVLEEKLKFKENEACTIAFYLSGIVQNSGQIVYLDKNDFRLKWRDVQLSGENIAWLDNIK